MRIDLHTHSSASDGTDTPADLVRAAEAAGLDVVALTDHDAMSGWAEAAQAADEVGITLVPGLEISTAYHHRGVHLLAYLPDPDDPPLVAALDRILAGRTARTPAIVDALRRHGIDDHRGRRTPRVRRVRRRRPAARGRRPGAAGPCRRPHPGIHRPAQPRQARLRQPLRRAAGGDDPARHRRRRGRGDRPSVGSQRRDRARRGGAVATCATSGWPGSRSTTRTTAPSSGRGCARSRPTSTSS